MTKAIKWFSSSKGPFTRTRVIKKSTFMTVSVVWSLITWSGLRAIRGGFIQCWPASSFSFSNSKKHWWLPKKRLFVLTRSSPNFVYIIFCVDFQNFSIRWAELTRVSEQTRQDGLTRVSRRVHVNSFRRTVKTSVLVCYQKGVFCNTPWCVL